jgi:hypothetical protein
VIFRFGLLAILATALLAYCHGAILWPFSWLVQNHTSTLAALLVGVLGSALAARSGGRALRRWQLFWLTGLAIFWLAATGLVLFAELAALAGPIDQLAKPVSLKLAKPYAVTTTLMLGYLIVLGRAIADRNLTSLPLILMLPACLALLVLANPAGESLLWLPCLAAVGLLPWRPEPPESAHQPEDRPPWCSAPALLAEMASLQCVAWGLLLFVLTFLGELWHGGLFSALFIGFGTGFAAWLLSGLLWGLAESFLNGRLQVARLAGLVFGPQATTFSVPE